MPGGSYDGNGPVGFVPDPLLGDPLDRSESGLEQFNIAGGILGHSSRATVMQQAVDLEHRAHFVVNEVDSADPLVPPKVDLASQRP